MPFALNHAQILFLLKNEVNLKLNTYVKYVLPKFQGEKNKPGQTTSQIPAQSPRRPLIREVCKEGRGFTYHAAQTASWRTSPYTRET